MPDKQRLFELLDAYDNLDLNGRKTLEGNIFAEFCQDLAIMSLDMSGFTSLTQRHGIVYYLSLIRRMNLVAGPVINKHGGEIVKFEADDLYAVFEEVHDALRAAVSLNVAYDALNLFSEEERDIFVKIGISFGPVLFVEGSDVYGDAVNISSKLSEDLAQRGEILVGEEAYERVRCLPGFGFEEIQFNVSGVAIKAYRLQH
jgi:class 3 adenylate cyclase